MLINEIFKFVEEEFACEIENLFLRPISDIYRETIKFKHKSVYIPVSVGLTHKNVFKIFFWQTVDDHLDHEVFVFDLNDPKSIDEMSEKLKAILSTWLSDPAFRHISN